MEGCPRIESKIRNPLTKFDVEKETEEKGNNDDHGHGGGQSDLYLSPVKSEAGSKRKEKNGRE